MQNLVSPCITSVCKKKVSPHNFLRKDCLCRRKWASDLFRGARSEYQYLYDTQELFQEAKVKVVCTGGYSYVSEKVAHTWHPYRPAVKAKTWKSHNMACFLCARTGSVNSSYREPQVVCHLLSCCVHTSITSEWIQGIWNEWQVLEVCHRTWRWESQKYLCWRRPWFLFCQCWAWAP